MNNIQQGYLNSILFFQWNIWRNRFWEYEFYGSFSYSEHDNFGFFGFRLRQGCHNWHSSFPEDQFRKIGSVVNFGLWQFFSWRFGGQDCVPPVSRHIFKSNSCLEKVYSVIILLLGAKFHQLLAETFLQTSQNCIWSVHKNVLRSFLREKLISYIIFVFGARNFQAVVEFFQQCSRNCILRFQRCFLWKLSWKTSVFSSFSDYRRNFPEFWRRDRFWSVSPKLLVASPVKLLEEKYTFEKKT